MTLRPDLTVNELVRHRPETLAVLAAAGIDTCCGGGESLERAAAGAGLDLRELLGRLEAALPLTAESAPAPSCGCAPRHP